MKDSEQIDTTQKATNIIDNFEFTEEEIARITEYSKQLITQLR